MNIKHSLTSITATSALLCAVGLANAQTTPDNAPVPARGNASSARGATTSPSSANTSPATNNAAPSAPSAPSAPAATAGTAGAPNSSAIGRSDTSGKAASGSVDNTSSTDSKTGPTSDNTAIGRSDESAKPVKPAKRSANYKKRNRGESATKGAKDNQAIGR